MRSGLRAQNFVRKLFLLLLPAKIAFATTRVANYKALIRKSTSTTFLRAFAATARSRGVGIVILHSFAARQIRVPIEEIDCQEEEGKHYATRTVDLRHGIVSRCSATSSFARRRSLGRRRLSRRRTASHARYLPMTHRGVLIRY